MSILSFNQVNLNLAGKQILDQANLQIHPQERIALVGRNGAGKSTILKLIQGFMTVDSGLIQRRNGLRVAGLSQDVPYGENESVYHFLVKGLGEKGEVIAKFYELSSQQDLDALSKVQAQMEQFQAWDVLPQIDAMATRLGVEKNAFVSELSGGMKRRALLAAALIAEPDLLVLDEPTNHLDLQAIEWLEAYLKQDLN